MKKKGHSRGRNSKNIDVQAMKEREAGEELTDHEQEDPPKDKDVLISINTSIVNTSIASSIRSNVVALDGEDSKKTIEEL